MTVPLPAWTAKAAERTTERALSSPLRVVTDNHWVLQVNAEASSALDSPRYKEEPTPSSRRVGTRR